MSKKKVINIVLGIVIIVVAALLGLNFMSAQQQQEYQPAASSDSAPTVAIPAQPEYVGIVIARRDIAKGSIISADMVKQRKSLASEMTADDLDNPDAVIGKIATIDIILGEKITRSKVALRPGEQQLSMKIPEGKRAITIPIDKISSLEGMIKPGDRVDVVGMFPYTNYTPQGQPFTENIVVSMFENVLVLAVGRSITGFSQEAGAYASITFALDQEASSILIYALQLGTIRLLLRSPDDYATSDTKTTITMSTLQQKLFSVQSMQPQAVAQTQENQAVSEPAQPKTEPNSGSGIEVFMGGESSSKNN